MQLGYVGLGKMGKNMVLRLHEKNVNVVAWNRSQQPREVVSHVGVTTVEHLEDLPNKLASPRIIWLMLPAGEITDNAIQTLLPHISPGDLIIDGANSYYKDTLRRKEKVLKAEVRFMDIGVSGGPEGARNGACLMIGGEKADFNTLTPLFEKLSAPDAFGYFGQHGAGHFAKMVHNGIEYGMMQAIAEGAAVLNESPEFDLDLTEIFRVYNNKSVIESRLVGWTKNALEADPKLVNISSKINHSGEGEWTVKTAREYDIEVPIIETSLDVRKQSSQNSNSFRDKVVSAMRGQFGGHDVKS
ncbi:6-phosphogluconate dehydrogenase (decarboxylating) [candidate division WWE3 bacterium CG_4_10_14_0_2_um_filter_41_14]|uniref:6-phosphogluconate dehydrogenase (Decarboxylating) n=1 Tax=candidate division WWE3 bacterium CG_4_10_14_0_2_um_filter_41_14 TaxID=1975072 RepID=A0A2M7TJ38_UNCKA|nr:MAG: 6-phosphogluconate dehydrogenase (decarboxylating) [candidate division WWE3 bacterium CG_4_10_14_0_2_um_filter_41_14]